jgi:hypothetical protein
MVIVIPAARLTDSCLLVPDTNTLGPVEIEDPQRHRRPFRDLLILAEDLGGAPWPNQANEPERIYFSSSSRRSDGSRNRSARTMFPSTL